MPMECMPVALGYWMKAISPKPHFIAFAQAVPFRRPDLTLVCRPQSGVTANVGAGQRCPGPTRRPALSPYALRSVPWAMRRLGAARASKQKHTRSTHGGSFWHPLSRFCQPDKTTL
jgi:hypothetical protein